MTSAQASLDDTIPEDSLPTTPPPEEETEPPGRSDYRGKDVTTEPGIGDIVPDGPPPLTPHKEDYLDDLIGETSKS